MTTNIHRVIFTTDHAAAYRSDLCISVIAETGININASVNANMAVITRQAETCSTRRIAFAIWLLEYVNISA